MYSGFLPINGTTKRFHYIATTSEQATTNNLIFWFNGGPGCSSMFGLTIEMGPYIMGDEDTRFKRNSHPWNKEAHVVYIEMPAGVGYSTCDEIGGPDASEISCYDVNKKMEPLTDDVVTKETLSAIVSFFQTKFPEWKKLNVYLAGESYAGIYIPYIMDKIDIYNEESQGTENDINLRGIIVGNGCTDW